MKARFIILMLLSAALCFYGCESTSLDEQQDDPSNAVPSEDKQEPDDGTGKTDPDNGGDDDEVVELPALPDLEDVDDVCTMMMDLDFMSYCYKNFDVNGDAKVSMSEARAVKTISCSTAEDFTGIEYFSNLKSFESYSAKILDLRYNTKLTDINFYVYYSSSSGSTYKSAPIEELDLRYCTNLTKISDDAFHGCTKLATIKLPSSLTSIGGSAFYKCTSLETVTSRPVTPPSFFTSSSIGSFRGCSMTTLYVPSVSVNAYTESDWASCFKEILPLEDD